MKTLSIIYEYMIAGLLLICFQSCQRHELHLAPTPESASVTYTVPFYQPSLEWIEYLITYTASDGTVVSDIISKDNIRDKEAPSILTTGNDYSIGQNSGMAFWVRNERFSSLPDSCNVTVRMMYKKSNEPPDRIDLIIPQPSMAAVIRYSDNSSRSFIGNGLDCQVISYNRQTDRFNTVYQGEYSSTCMFFPTPHIISSRH